MAAVGASLEFGGSVFEYGLAACERDRRSLAREGAGMMPSNSLLSMSLQYTPAEWREEFDGIMPREPRTPPRRPPSVPASPRRRDPRCHAAQNLREGVAALRRRGR